MFDTYITVIGNAVEDPVLRTTGTGRPVARFRLASTARQRDPGSNEFVDSDRLFVNVVCWREMAVHVCESVRKGHPVVVHGRIATREYVKDEQPRTSYEITADAIGHNLARGRAQFTGMTRPMITAPLPEPVRAELPVAQLAGAAAGSG